MLSRQDEIDRKKKAKQKPLPKTPQIRVILSWRVLEGAELAVEQTAR